MDLCCRIAVVGFGTFGIAESSLAVVDKRVLKNGAFTNSRISNKIFVTKKLTCFNFIDVRKRCQLY
jgi:hypothetical protein